MYMWCTMLIKKFTILAIAAFTLSGCIFSSITENNIEAHGYVPNIDQIQSMRTEQPTKQQVQSVLGKPFVVDIYDNNYWYYLFYRTKQYGFSAKKIMDFKLVEISFNEEQVQSVTEYNQSILQDIDYNTSQSETGGKTLGIIEQVVGNIGKVRTQQKQR